MICPKSYWVIVFCCIMLGEKEYSGLSKFIYSCTHSFNKHRSAPGTRICAGDGRRLSPMVHRLSRGQLGGDGKWMGGD